MARQSSAKAKTTRKRAAAPRSHHAPPRPYDVEWYGWVPDFPDHRDFLYAAPTPYLRNLPAKVSLRSKCPRKVYDQGQLGSCTGNAIAAAIEFDLMKQKQKVFTPSRLFIYYNERAMEHSINQDSGAQIRDGIKSVATLGACPEIEWPYDITKFSDKPPAKCYADAKKDVVKLYQRLVQDLNTMKGCLAEGYPFVFGFSVYTSFEGEEVARTGVLNMPSTREKLLGGHAVLGVGYDDATRMFLVRNSWGKDWGDGGYFYMPYSYLTDDNLASDFWTIRAVS